MIQAISGNRRAVGARRWGALAVAAYLSMLYGCATYSSTIQPIERNLAAQQPQLALTEFEKLETPERGRVLYLMNKGLLLRMTGDYAGSTEALEAAKNRISELSAVSVSEQAGSLFINDATKSYVGDEFEQVMVYAYLALNYLEQHRIEAARVEALQVDIRLREIAQQASEDTYTEDAFARYLTGIIYEEQREWSDAMIAYRKAYEAYQKYALQFGLAIPDPLKHDLIRLAERMGLSEELKRYRETFGIKETPSVAALRDQGELIFTLHSGLAPFKREQSVTIVNPNNGRLMRLALPQYLPRSQPLANARITIDGRSVVTSCVQDIDAIAVKTLEAKMPAITARALARMIAKDQIAKGARDRDGAQELLGLALNVANTLTERADTRSWFTLPSQIHLARMVLAPGRYRARIELFQDGGHLLHASDVDITVQRGEKTYLSQHWVSSNIEVRQ